MALSEGTGAWEGWRESCIDQGDRVEFPPAGRNAAPILEVLQQHLGGSSCSSSSSSGSSGPSEGTVLELASGTGQHVAAFAAALPHLKWQPSDLTDGLFPSVRAHCSTLPNVLDPLLLDCGAPADSWGVPAGTKLTAAVCINMTHLAPWEVTLGLLQGSMAHINPGGHLFIYGPFIVEGRHTSDGNEGFDASLRAQNTEWGYRDVVDVERAAVEVGWRVAARLAMPANNTMLVFKKG